MFGKSKDAVSFFVGDNENLNKSIAKMIGVPLIGCYSHRFNLAVRKYLEPNEPLLEMVNTLMIKLSGLKHAAELRKKNRFETC